MDAGLLPMSLMRVFLNQATMRSLQQYGIIALSPLKVDHKIKTEKETFQVGKGRMRWFWILDCGLWNENKSKIRIPKSKFWYHRFIND